MQLKSNKLTNTVKSVSPQVKAEPEPETVRLDIIYKKVEFDDGKTDHEIDELREFKEQEKIDALNHKK